MKLARRIVPQDDAGIILFAEKSAGPFWAPRFFRDMPRQMAVTFTARSLLLFLGSGSTS